MYIAASFWVIIVRLFMFLQSQDSKKRSVLRKLQSQPPTVYTPQPHSWDNPLPIWAVTPSPATWDPVYLQQVRTDHIDQSEQRTSQYRPIILQYDPRYSSPSLPVYSNSVFSDSVHSSYHHSSEGHNNSVFEGTDIEHLITIFFYFLFY